MVAIGASDRLRLVLGVTSGGKRPTFSNLDLATGPTDSLNAKPKSLIVLIAGLSGERTMHSNKRWGVPAASFLLLCALHSAPRALAQKSCMVTFTCPSAGGGCASNMGGAVTTRGPFPFASTAACNTQARSANSNIPGVGVSCSCTPPDGDSAAGSAPAAPVAPGHEFDSTIKEAISAGLAGKLSPGNAVGFVGLGLLGNALFAPKTTNPAEQQQQEAQRQLNDAADQLNRMGMFLFKNGNYTGAINEFQQALAKTPNDANILHNLEMARQRLKDTAIASQTSGALGQLLGTAPAGAGTSGTALNLVNLDSDPNVVDLRGTTRTSPESLKGELDGVFGGNSAASAPSNPQVQPQAQNQDIDQLFQSPQATPSSSQTEVEKTQPAPSSSQAEAGQKQVDDIFKDDSGGSADSDASLKDAVADSRSDQNAAPSPGSNASGNGTRAATGTGTGFFGLSNANPSDPSSPLPTNMQPAAAPAPGPDVNARDQVKTAAGSATKALGLADPEAGANLAGQTFDRGGSKSDGDAAPVVTVATPTGTPYSAAAAALAAHIPSGKQNDPAIQNNMAYFQKLDGLKSDTLTKLAAVQQQIDSGTGDAQVLNAQKATLTNNLNQINTDQTNIQTQIKVNLGVTWIEDPKPATTSTPTTTSTPATP